MRELTVRIRFTCHSLGNVRKHYSDQGRKRSYYVMPRNPSNRRVMFMPRWWTATLKRAAEILCRHHAEVEEIRFSPEIEGETRPVPAGLFTRYAGDRNHSRHEVFAPGDVISVTCVVPSKISDEDFLQLLRYAGKYCGISPAHSNNFGFYEVVSIRPTTPEAMREIETEGPPPGRATAAVSELAEKSE